MLNGTAYNIVDQYSVIGKDEPTAGRCTFGISSRPIFCLKRVPTYWNIGMKLSFFLWTPVTVRRQAIYTHTPGIFIIEWWNISLCAVKFEPLTIYGKYFSPCYCLLSTHFDWKMILPQEKRKLDRNLDHSVPRKTGASRSILSSQTDLIDMRNSFYIISCLCWSWILLYG
jgi:hypothetical protein